MVFNTLTVGAAVTPSIIETYFSHYLNRAPLRQKPTAHISYHEGLRLIRQFLDYSSKHTIEDLQGFTSQWVPAPHWVRINDAEIAPKFLERAVKTLQSQLGNRGLEKIGGKTWWQWRRPEQPLRAEWIEMKKEYNERKRTGEKCERVILYVHGGAYYFGSVDEHRYQLQRHARKLKARVLAPRYRLAPQFPFPCGLFDCLATYFYLLEHFEPNQILFAGDSAGGGMVLSMLVVLRDQGQPLPAGSILLSPWCDLTHSFPSVAGDGIGDYIPPHGFHHRPSMAWPPPPQVKKPVNTYGPPTDAVELPATAGLDMKARRRKRSADGEEGDDDDDELISPISKKAETAPVQPLPQFGHELTMYLDGQTIEMKEQIQMYTTNELLAHPLVSPVMQPSLGGLPPMLIQVGGAELLRDEQIYLAHKAANPQAYPPNETIMKEFDPSGTALKKYPPTNVQLQVWDDLCHVPHTLSFTRPAKYMYRSVAQFGAWALAHAQQKSIEIPNDDALSFISSGDEDDDDSKSTVQSIRKEKSDKRKASDQDDEVGAVGKAGDPLPTFREHMIRQRVTRHGNVFPLAPQSEMSCLALDPATIGVIKPGPVRKWLAVKATNDQRFASEKKKVLKRREKETASGYDAIHGENPPPSALVNRRRKGIAPEEKKRGKSWGLAMWSGWGSSHDEHTLQREQKTLERKESMVVDAGLEAGRSGSKSNLLAVPSTKRARPKKRRNSSVSMMTNQMPWATSSSNRPMSPYSQVNDRGQVEESYSTPVLSRGPSTMPRRTSNASSNAMDTRPATSAADSPIPVERQDQEPSIPTIATIAPDSEKVPGSQNTFISPSHSRPHNGTQMYPFKLKENRSNVSMVTLESRGPSGSSTPHSELVGDTPGVMELSSEKRSMEVRPADEPPATTTPNVTIEQAEEAIARDSENMPPRDIVSPVEESEERATSGGVSPLEVPSPTPPFRLRNTIFDPRVSMLGSIGADGMPNAHHDFPGQRYYDGQKYFDKSAETERHGSTGEGETRTDTVGPVDDSAVNVSQEVPAPAVGVENAAPIAEAVKTPESVHAATFELRHIVDPAPASDEPAVQPQSPTGANAPEVVRSSGSSNNTEHPPPAYESMPMTNVVIPETNSDTRTVPESQQDEYDDDRPPTPPPKDDKPYMLGKSPNVSRKVEREVPASKLSAAPTIGNLSFENEGQRGEKRPTIEKFVTASEGRQLQQGP